VGAVGCVGGAEDKKLKPTHVQHNGGGGGGRGRSDGRVGRGGASGGFGIRKLKR